MCKLTLDEKQEYDDLLKRHISELTQGDWQRFHELNDKRGRFAQELSVISLLVDGLTTDGAHHKQYFVEKVLKILAPIEFDGLKSANQWEDGIAP